MIGLGEVLVVAIRILETLWRSLAVFNIRNYQLFPSWKVGHGTTTKRHCKFTGLHSTYKDLAQKVDNIFGFP
jgi:hypothetical protein